jgi:isopentenyl-diphosphate delta-isomerase
MKEEEKIILVDEHDEMIGIMDKMEAHRQGLLHRAFSIYIFNSKGEMLLQQRALTKYHSGGLWTNACCSHPLPGEKTKDAAARRLMEELGFETPIEKIFEFVYKAAFENGLTEHEFDHVFAGEYEAELNADPGEVMDYSYKEIPAIKSMLQDEPEKFTAWFIIAFPKIEAWWKDRYANPTIATR